MNEQKQILYEINGIKYILIAYPIIGNKVKEFNELTERYKCIQQGVEKVHQSFWGTSYVICNVLVPEDKIFEFQKETL